MKKRYIIFPILILGFINFVNAFQKGTSGISKIEYKVERCNPIFGCKTGYFSSLNTIVGPNSTNSFVQNNNFHTICTNCTDNMDIKEIFSNIKLKGEGVYTITVHSYDKVKYGAVKKCDGGYTPVYTDGTAPGNCSKLILVYKIDKTHPNIVNPLSSDSSYPAVDESSPQVYIGRSDKTATVKSYDAVSNNDNSLNEKFIRGDISNVLDTPFTNSSIQRKKLKTIYYSDSNKQITIKLNLANYFSQDRYPSYLSSLDKIEFLDGSHNVKKSWTLNTLKYNTWQWSDSIKNIFGNNVNQKVFYFRLYDKAGNYSETPIYVVKDDKAPITLNEFLNTFTFKIGGEKIFYTTTQNGPLVNSIRSIPSKFFAANDNLGIKFSLSDKKNGNTNKENSGILKFKLRIENSNNCNFDEYTFTPTDNLNQENTTTVEQSWNITHDFSKVDNCTQDSKKTYRYYKAYIVSIDDDGNEYENKICDKVGNCTSIAPFSFRVVANKLSEDKSTVQILTGNLLNGKMLANGKSYYAMMLTLKDKYGNKIVPVYSQEDGKLIKTSKLTLSFHNGLYLDQINKSGGYGVFKKDLESDTKNSFDGMLTGSFVMEENSQATPNGVYKFKIYSVVPTSDLYPWISSGSYLQLNNINFLSQDVGGTDLTKDNDIGQFDESKFSGDNINKIEINTGNLSYDDTVNKFLKVDSNDYGKLISNTFTLFTENNFTNNAGKKIRFSFASPVLIGLYNIKNISEGVKNIYAYNLWNIDNSSINGGNFSIQEKWITNNPYDFTQGSGSYIETGDKIEIIGKNFDNSVKNLPIIGNFNNNNKKISKFTKISIKPELASFVDKNNDHIALGTKIIYEINGNKVVLPSDGRGVSNDKINTDINNKQYGDSISIFNPNNGLDVADSNSYDDSELKPFVKNIKILGLTSSNWHEKQTFEQDKNKHITIGGDIKKWKVKNNIKKKVEIMTRGVKWNNSCTAGSCNNKYKYGDDYIVPINGDLTFNNDYKVDNNITYIVKGNVYINGNIYKGKKNVLLSLVVLNPLGFNKKDLEFTNNFNTFKNNNKGFVFIKSNVTNIDAYIFAEGSLLSYDGSKIFDGSNTLDTDKGIFNQLYVRGGIISSNTIGASRLPDTDNKKCPWFIKNCNTNIAQAFDLVYLRRYMLTDASIYGGPNGKEVPYIPISIANNISSYNSNKPYMGGKRYCTISDNGSSINCNHDDHNKLKNIPNNGMEYPLYIEFDPTIKLNMPEVFKP